MEMASTANKPTSRGAWYSAAMPGAAAMTMPPPSSPSASPTHSADPAQNRTWRWRCTSTSSTPKLTSWLTMLVTT